MSVSIRKIAAALAVTALLAITQIKRALPAIAMLFAVSVALFVSTAGAHYNPTVPCYLLGFGLCPKLSSPTGGPDPSELTPEPTVGSVATDRAALVALYHATDGPNWTRGWRWLSEKPLGEWEGVSTNGKTGRVTGIHIGVYKDDLDGELPPELGNLTELRSLRLWGRLSGTLPAELGNLANLRELHLCDNQLTGEIPAELGNLANLEKLYLCDNQLTGEIPAELGNLASLDRLYLSGNQLKGEIPAELGNLTNLQDLVLYDNQLTGELPAELGKPDGLQTLSLGGNQLTGAIPAEAELGEVRSLYLAGNKFTGCIPTALRDIPGHANDLDRLDLPYCDEQ